MTRRLSSLTPEQADRQRATIKAYRATLDPEKVRAQARRQRAANPEKYRAKFRKWYAANPAYHLMKTYGLTAKQHAAIFEQQGRRCAVCSTSNPGKHWHTDHCHKTNRVRGILCHGCNVSLGLVKDDPERLRRLADYVEANQ